jgi:hypothetical protein
MLDFFGSCIYPFSLINFFYFYRITLHQNDPYLR